MVFRCGAFAAAGVGEHVDVPLQGEGRLAAGRYDTLDDEQLAVRCHGLAAALQQLQALLVFPVVQDARQQVDIASGRNGGEEVATDHLAAIGESVLAQPVPRRRDDVRDFEDDTGQVRVRRENGGQQRAVAPADVDDGARSGEVVDVRELGEEGAPRRHRTVEDAGSLGVVRRSTRATVCRRPAGSSGSPVRTLCGSSASGR